ncbi:MAG: hypothetical protein AAF843_21580 [Bacteroidota bacterium]
MRFILLLLLVVVISCDISDNDTDPSASFLRIYDNNTFNTDFTPIDVQQTADGGYIVLGTSALDNSLFSGVYLMKVDENGSFVNEQNLSEQFISPAGELMKLDNRYYFMAMNQTGFNAFLFAVNDSGRVADPIPLGTNYPLAATNVGNEIIYANYDNANKRTQIGSSTLQDGTIESSIPSQGYNIGEGEDGEIDKLIVEHFTRTNRKLPFFVGKTSSGLYFFNGFYNFTLSTVFSDFSVEPVAQLQGTRETAGLSSAVHLGGEQFAISRFEDGNNFVIPQTQINLGSRTESSVNIDGNPFPELIDNAPVKLKLLDINSNSVLIYGSTTQSGQIILLAYSPATGELLGTKYLGFSNPFTLASFNLTSDNGLIVLGSTSVAGRFERFCLFKLSASELAEFTN